MEAGTTPPYANCQRSQTEVNAFRTQLVALQATVEQLRRQLAASLKNSSNSSRPLSSDIVKPPKTTPSGQARCKPGGKFVDFTVMPPL